MSNKRNNPKRHQPKKRKPGKPRQMAGKIISFGSLVSKFGSQSGSTTPAEITPIIVAFAKKVAGTEPIRVPVVGIAPAMRCHHNVRQYVEDFGGTAVNGWMVWQGKSILEAEFHAIVKREDGSFIDITKTVDGEKEIVFFPDHERKVEVSPMSDGISRIVTYKNVNARDCVVQERHDVTESYQRIEFDNLKRVET